MHGSKYCTNMDRKRGEKRAVVGIGEADDADSCDGLSCSMAATSPCDCSGAGCSDGSTASTTAPVPSKKQKCGTRTTTNKETLLAYLNAFPQQGLVVVSNKLWCDSCHDYIASNRDSVKKHVKSYVSGAVCVCVCARVGNALFSAVYTGRVLSDQRAFPPFPTS